MDIIARNFFRLLRAGALHEEESLEPMSHFKWQRLWLMVKAQHVESIAVQGIRMQPLGQWTNIPEGFGEEALEPDVPAELPNTWMSRKLKAIEYEELHAIDTNVASLEVLRIIVETVSTMLNQGIMLKGILTLGSYLRNEGNKVDFVKLERWLNKMHLRRMAQLQGSMLVSVLHFEQEEIPFIERLEPYAYQLVIRSVAHTASDTAEEWHFRQSRLGFVTNNSKLLRRNLRRSFRYITYAPVSTITNYLTNFARSLQEIEE